MSEDEHKQKKIKAEDGETAESLARRRDAAHEKLVVIGKELHDVRKAARGLHENITRKLLDNVEVRGAPRPPVFRADFEGQSLVINYSTGEKKPRRFRKMYNLSVVGAQPECTFTGEDTGCSWGYGDMSRYGGKPHQSAYCDRFAAVVSARMTNEIRQELACLRRAIE